MISSLIVAAGMALLVVSEVARHDDAQDAVVFATSWVGSIMVIVGVGKILFLDDGGY